MRYLEYILDDDLSGTQDLFQYEPAYFSFKDKKTGAVVPKENYQYYLQ